MAPGLLGATLFPRSRSRGCAQPRPTLGLALSSGPCDSTHGLWPFLLIPLEDVQSCDSSMFPGAWWEGLQPAVSHRKQGLEEQRQWHSDTWSVQGVWMTRE